MRPTLSLSVRLGGLVGVFAVLIAFIVGVTYWVTSSQEKDTLAVNLAGRQRMLTQKYAKEVLSELNDRQVVAAAEQRASTLTTQIMADRAYYSKNVVGKLQSESQNFRVGADYHNDGGAIPLPATFVREVSQAMHASDKYRYDLLSKYNINKEKGLSDDFEKNAWNALAADPRAPQSALVPAGEGVEMRYATADLATSDSCVSCHNAHAESPKKDFALNDLMGMLVVSVPVTRDATLAGRLLSIEKQTDKPASAATQRLFELTLAALTHGGQTHNDLDMTQPIDVAAAEAPGAAEQLAKVQASWEKLVGVVAAARAAEADYTSSEFVGMLRDISQVSAACLGEMNRAVGMLEAYSNERGVTGRSIQYGALAVSLVLLCVVLWYIRSRITRPITRVIERLAEGAASVDEASGQVSSASQQLASGASEQASSLEETSAALEEMSAMTRGNAECARKANDLAASARGNAERGDKTMTQLNDAVKAINQSSGEISKIIKVIEEIAFQTNLLALNAAVEAARAGEHGKGFAVVAEEVRSLAQRSAQAARDTSTLIEGSVVRAQEGAKVAEGASDVFNSIAENVKQVAELLDGIARASDEQAQGVEQVSTAAAEMERVTQQNAAGAEESAAAAAALNTQASSVKSTVAELAALIGGAAQRAGDAGGARVAESDTGQADW